jgi:hypothetical protein
MPRIRVKCSSCDHEFKAGDLLPPSKAKCPKCGKKDGKLSRLQCPDASSQGCNVDKKPEW